MKKTRSIRPAIQFSVAAAEALAPLISRAYKLPQLKTIDYLARGFNDTYRVTTASAEVFYLRLYRHDRGAALVDAELKLLRHLRQDMQDVANAVPLQTGALSFKLTMPEGQRRAALFYSADGESVQKPSEDRCRALGATLARLHLSMDGYKGTIAARPVIDTRYLTSHTLAFARQRLKKHRATDLARLIDITTKLTSGFKGLLKRGSAFGICHGDVHVRNARFGTSGCTLFDFDFCGRGHRVYDIATFLWSRFQIEADKEEDAETRYKAFLSGYQSIRQLSEEELAAIPSFVLLREIWAIGIKISQAPVWGSEGTDDRFWDQRFSFIDDWLDYSKRN